MYVNLPYDFVHYGTVSVSPDLFDPSESGL